MTLYYSGLTDGHLCSVYGQLQSTLCPIKDLLMTINIYITPFGHTHVNVIKVFSFLGLGMWEWEWEEAIAHFSTTNPCMPRAFDNLGSVPIVYSWNPIECPWGCLENLYEELHASRGTIWVRELRIEFFFFGAKSFVHCQYSSVAAPPELSRRRSANQCDIAILTLIKTSQTNL